MSTERPLPATPAAASAARVTRLRWAALLIGCIGTSCGEHTEPYVPLSSSSEAWGGVAEVRVERCGSGWCEGFWLGPTSERAVRVLELPKGARCDEIAWSKDGTRVALVVDGYQLWVFDTTKQALAGRVNLVEMDTQPTSRVGRGVTFSDNGAAITFDKCPRGRSGCEPGMIALR